MREETTIPGELQAIHARLDEGDRRFRDMERRISAQAKQLHEVALSQKVMLEQMKTMQATLEKNTEITEDVRDFMRAGKAGATFLKYTAMTVGPLIAAATAIYHFGRGGPTP